MCVTFGAYWNTSAVFDLLFLVVLALSRLRPVQA